MTKTFQVDGRWVEIEYSVEIGEGAFVQGGMWLGAEPGDEIELTDKECQRFEQLMQEELYQDGYEHMAARAYDDAKDARWDD